MASAYGTLATGGVHYDPIVITKVLDRNGATIFQAQPQGKRELKHSVAYAATQVLQGVITQGTAKAADIGRPAAGKTGTTQSNRDCWFIGYTPQLVTSVWVGYTPERTVVINGRKGFGGTVAAPIWARFMRAALVGVPVRDFAWAASPDFGRSFSIPVSKETQYAIAHPALPKGVNPAVPQVSPSKPAKSSGGTKGGGKGNG
jgi:membrane peptidoglycan carboxypeptidase